MSCAVAAYVAASALPQSRGLIPGDAPSFYFAGRLAAAGEVERLYDPQAITEGWQRLSQEGVHRSAAKHDNYFLRPAFSAYLFAPLGFLSFGAGWRLFSVLGASCAVVIAWRFPQWFGALSEDRLWVPWTVAYFPFVWSIGEGQDTILLTLCLGAALHLILSGREAAGGAVLALLMVKPHLAWGVPLALLAGGRRRASMVFALLATALLGVSGALVGTDGMRQWAALLTSPETDLVPESMFNLRALELAAGTGAAISVAAALAVALVFVAWRGTLQQKLTCGVLAPLLFSPHTYPQDLSMLAILPFLARNSVVKWAVLAPWLYLAPPGQGGNWIFLALATGCVLSLGLEAFRKGATTTQRRQAEGALSLQASQKA